MREKMVTRTIATANVEVMVCDVNTASTDTIKVTTAPMKQYDEAKLLKRIKKEIETDSLKAVAIVDYEEVEKLYGMTESQFIEMAQILPPRQTQEQA